MHNQYETTFIMTPVLSEGDAKTVVKGYIEFLKKNGAEVVHEEHWGLRQLAYPIAKKTTGIYHHIEFKGSSDIVNKLELVYRRDEDNIMRFLTVKLDKFSIKYNEDKRKGLIGKGRKTEKTVKPTVEKIVNLKQEEGNNNE